MTKKDPNDPSRTLLLLLPVTIHKEKNCYAFPGELIKFGETPEKACIRGIEDDFDLKCEKPKLVCVLSKPNKIAELHTVSLVYHVEIDPKK